VLAMQGGIDRLHKYTESASNQLMPGRKLVSATGLLFASMAMAQETGVFPLTHTDTHGLQQIANAIRSIADPQEISVDEAKQSISVHGTAEQVGLAEWLCAELDKLPGPAAAAARHDYPAALGGGDRVQLSYLAHVPSPVALQEMLNATRAIADIQRASGYPQLNAIVIRATPDRAAAADWVMDELDRASGPESQVFHEYTVNFDRRANIAKVLFLANARTPPAIQELVNATRSISDLQRVFPYHSLRALALRGPAEDVALAEWVIKQLDQPAPQGPDTEAHEYQLPRTVSPDGGVARVFYLSTSLTAQGLQDVAYAVRSAANIQRAYPVHQVNAITVRGSNDQVARAEQIIKQHDR